MGTQDVALFVARRRLAVVQYQRLDRKRHRNVRKQSMSMYSDRAGPGVVRSKVLDSEATA